MEILDKAMIFAAGLGTRLKPLTDEMPKALVPVCGRPLLWHSIMKLKKAGVKEVVVNVHHFADKIIDYLKSEDFGIEIKISDERDFLRETGGGLRFASPLLLNCSSSFIVHNVDIISDLDIIKFASCVREDALSTIVVSERETKRYFLFNEDMRLVGWTNEATGEVKSPYEDLDARACRKLAFSGIHLISKDIFEVFEKEKAGERFSITDFYINICAKYPIYGYEPEKLRLMDIGKQESLSLAESFLLSL